MKHLLLLLCTAISLQSLSQVKFEELSLNDALKKASSSGKMVYIHFVSITCDQCNEVAEEAFENSDLGKLMNEKCIALKMEINRDDRQYFIDQYNPEESIGSFYLRSDGDLVYRTVRTTTLATDYIKDINTAWSKMTESRIALKQLDQIWNSEQSLDAMEMNLNRRNELKLPLDSLLDVYASLLPEDSLRSFRTLQFISRMAPKINSKAYTNLHKDGDFFKQAWYRMSLAERIDINNRIIHKTMKEAVENKDLKLATRTISFIWGVNGTSSEKIRRKKYDNAWMGYYRAVADTANYIKVATYFYDKYYVNVSADSIRREDSIITTKRFKAAKIDTIIATNNKTTQRRTVTASNLSQYYSIYLLDGAKALYRFDTKKIYRSKILQYATKALEFYESPDALSNYAKIAYNNGLKDEAIKAMEKAIEILQKRNFNVQRYEAVLAKMKSNEIVEVK